MVKVYGIKTCDSVRKALKFFKNNSIEVEFIDIKKDAPTSNSIEYWVKKAGIDLVFNKRGTKYRSLKLKELNLDEQGKVEWLCKEPMLLKRPIIEVNENDIIVGFNEDEYRAKLL